MVPPLTLGAGYQLASVPHVPPESPGSQPEILGLSLARGPRLARAAVGRGTEVRRWLTGLRLPGCEQDGFSQKWGLDLTQPYPLHGSLLLRRAPGCPIEDSAHGDLGVRPACS